jgi:hypothetical protein
MLRDLFPVYVGVGPVLVFLFPYCWIWRHFLRLVELLHKQSFCSLPARALLCADFILPPGIFGLQWISVLVIAEIQFFVCSLL